MKFYQKMLLTLSIPTVMAASCTKPCDPETAKPGDECWVEPVDFCKDVKDALIIAVNDSTAAANKVVELEEVALMDPEDIRNAYYNRFNSIAENMGLPKKTLLEKAKLHRLTIASFLQRFPNSVNKENLILWDEACRLYIEEEHDKPAKKREEVKQCEDIYGKSASLSKAQKNFESEITKEHGSN